jgi:hypothetical protein
LIARGAIVLVARGSDNEAYADRIAAWSSGRRCIFRSISTAGGRMLPKRSWPSFRARANPE